MEREINVNSDKIWWKWGTGNDGIREGWESTQNLNPIYAAVRGHKSGTPYNR